MKYHLGCGKKYLKGYVNVEHPLSELRGVKADVYEDLMSFKIPLDSAHEIRSQHVFEHFGYVDSLVLLIRWTLALKMGGVLRIEVPAVEQLIKDLGKNAEVDCAITRLLYGDQEESWAYHLNGWTGGMLEKILCGLGYVNMQKRLVNRASKGFPNYGILVTADRERLIYSPGLELVASDYLKSYFKLPSEERRYQEQVKRYSLKPFLSRYEFVILKFPSWFSREGPSCLGHVFIME